VVRHGAGDKKSQQVLLAGVVRSLLCLVLTFEVALKERL